MNDSAKYLIRARIVADGVVERSDVVGAVFGQTEGLLGDELDLRDLQDSSKVGRIDVDIDSENGQSFGEITVASGLDKVETAILAASLETISRVGPCEARVEVIDIEDTRAAERREVVERAKELLRESFDESVMNSTEILDEVREAARVERISRYEGLPAGPRVMDSDAVIVVEGRADVLTLLNAGIKNAVAVEGTDVPMSVADLTKDRTVTAFLDGDRGGQLILRELAQVGDVDFVTFAPEDRSVEDLSREDVLKALREKVPYEQLAAEEGTTHPGTPGPDHADEEVAVARPSGGTPATETADPAPATEQSRPDLEDQDPSTDEEAAEPSSGDATLGDSPSQNESETEADGPEEDSSTEPRTLRGHVETVIGGTGRARILDEQFVALADVPAADTFDALAEVEERPYALVLDGELSQKVLDVAAQRGVAQAVAASTGEFVKQPASVRVLTADQFESVA